MNDDQALFGTRLGSYELVFGQIVTIQTVDLLKDKRTNGDLILSNGMNLNQELVKQG